MAATKESSLQLHQILAISKGVKSQAKSTLDTIHKLLQHAQLFDGEYRQYTPKEEGGMLFEHAPKLVQHSVRKLQGDLRKAVSEDLDLSFQKDRTNQAAKASVVIDGKEIIRDAPVTFLLNLEKQLTDLKTIISVTPTLSNDQRWELDANSGNHISKPSISYKTEKKQDFVVVVPATDKHAAQVKDITKDVIIGSWEIVKHSGALPSTEKEVLLSKITQLIQAVKLAREEANKTTVVAREQIGKAIFDYLAIPG